MPKPRGYPIGALFVLVTVCAVLAAGITPLARLPEGEVSSGDFLKAVGAGAVCGLLVGGVLGLFYYRYLTGIALGIAAGLVIGATAGALSLLPGNKIVPAAAAMTAGSGLVIGIALLMRRGET
jgi:hypothetical protein